MPDTSDIWRIKAQLEGLISIVRSLDELKPNPEKSSNAETFHRRMPSTSAPSERVTTVPAQRIFTRSLFASHRMISKISCAGSAAVGMKTREVAAHSNLKKVILEVSVGTLVAFLSR
jgi:hypothetical protein